MKKLKGELMSIRYGRVVTIRLTNLEEATGLSPETSIWLEERTTD